MKEILGISGNGTSRAEFINLQKSMKVHLLPFLITKNLKMALFTMQKEKAR